MTDRTAAFWLVWNPERTAPVHRHNTEYSAIKEAERLARNNRGQRFIVLRSIEERVVDDMRKIEHTIDIACDDMPF